MASFVDFFIKIADKFGIFYVFSIILLLVILYIAFKYFLKSLKIDNKEIFDEKQANILSALLAISISFLAINMARTVDLLKYFSSFLAFLAIIIVFILIFLSFIYNSRVTPDPKSKTPIFIILLVFVIVFVFISFGLAFQDILIELSLNPSSTPLGAIMSKTMKPEILIIPFIFIFIGVAIMLIGR